MTDPVRIGGVGAILVDGKIKVARLPYGAGLPLAGTKLSATGEQVQEVISDWSRRLPTSAYVSQVGGPVPVALAYANGLGAETRFVGAIGHDDGSDLIRRFADDYGLQSRFLQRRPGASGQSLVWLDDNGNRSILFSENTLEPVDAALVPRDFLVGLDVFHIDGREPEAAKVFGDIAKGAGLPVVYDVGNWKTHSADLFEVATHVQLPRRSAAALAGMSLDELNIRRSAPSLAQQIRAENDLEMVVITDGEDGLAFSTRNRASRYVAAHDVDTIDSNGAGDAFAGALGWALANEYSPGNAVALANAAGGWKCSMDGHSVPTLEALTKFMRDTPARSAPAWELG